MLWLACARTRGGRAMGVATGACSGTATRTTVCRGDGYDSSNAGQAAAEKARAAAHCGDHGVHSTRQRQVEREAERESRGEDSSSVLA